MNFYDNVAKAYAEIDRLRAELVQMATERDRWKDSATERWAAIARVRDLCERWSRAGYSEYGHDVLRALDGGTE